MKLQVLNTSFGKVLAAIAVSLMISSAAAASTVAGSAYDTRFHVRLVNPVLRNFEPDSVQSQEVPGMEIGTDKPFGTIPRLEYALLTDDGAPVIYDAPAVPQAFEAFRKLKASSSGKIDLVLAV
ncbi:MAG: hypothetical protein QOE55_4167 [Acidobacteriaceae bacterium]|jgi:hypothetical protein|nr:hypothetical protein [Acidobacteriaceae bacterium]